MESWVTIKKENQISKVPYQAFKDVFESAGFVIIDENLNSSPTFSIPETIEKEPDAEVQEIETPSENLVEQTNNVKEDNNDEKPNRSKKPNSHKHKK